jgi:hypothetical protein
MSEWLTRVYVRLFTPFLGKPPPSDASKADGFAWVRRGHLRLFLLLGAPFAALLVIAGAQWWLWVVFGVWVACALYGPVSLTLAIRRERRRPPDPAA